MDLRPARLTAPEGRWTWVATSPSCASPGRVSDVTGPTGLSSGGNALALRRSAAKNSMPSPRPSPGGPCCDRRPELYAVAVVMVDGVTSRTVDCGPWIDGALVDKGQLSRRRNSATTPVPFAFPAVVSVSGAVLQHPARASFRRATGAASASASGWSAVPASPRSRSAGSTGPSTSASTS